MPCAAQTFPDATNLVDDHGQDLDLYECTMCGLLQISARPVPYYREVIRAVAFSPEMRKFRLEQLATWIDHHALRGKHILEIGCGKGEYLELLGTAGACATGLEYAISSVADCRRRGLNVLRGFLARPGQRLPAPAFDGFICLNFMEHWPKPVDTLRAIGNNITPNAIGLIEVPNYDMIVREGLFSEFILDHLCYFTRETFRFALQKAGFSVLKMESVWHDYVLSAVVQKRPTTDFSSLTHRRNNITRELHEFIARFPPRSVAVWGAGHQALAVLAIAGLNEKIRYVVDSAPFKQGKFTPATHLPIVAPGHLIEEPAAAIIVMAAAYSDEVARLIREHHQLDIPVAILRSDSLEAA